MTRVEVQIGALVVDGFPAGEGERIAALLEAGLAHRLEVEPGSDPGDGVAAAVAELLEEAR